MSRDISKQNSENKDEENERKIDPSDTSEWSHTHERILIEWADKAMCYRWLHNRAHLNYKFYVAWFTIPVIIMSTVTGTANFAQERFPPNTKIFAQIGIGSVNLIAGILTTIAQFLKVGELNEAHRVSSLLWGKFYRNIKVELSKSPDDRTPPRTMLRIYKDEYDRLMEVSPIIPPNVVLFFKETFSGVRERKKVKTKFQLLCCDIFIGRESMKRTEDIDREMKSVDTVDYHTETNSTHSDTETPSSKGFKMTQRRKLERLRAAFDEIIKPEICDELQSTKHVCYKESDNDMIQSKKQLELKETELLKKQEILRSYQNASDSICLQFYQLNGREPTLMEFKSNIGSSVPPDSQTLYYHRSIETLPMNRV